MSQLLTDLKRNLVTTHFFDYTYTGMYMLAIYSEYLKTYIHYMHIYKTNLNGTLFVEQKIQCKMCFYSYSEIPNIVI